MNNRLRTVLSLLVVSAAALSLHAAPQAVQGLISDSMCGHKHMMPGKSDAECVRECVKAGSSYVLVTGNKVYTLDGDKAQLAAFAGQHVSVQGEFAGSQLHVASIKPAGR